jgi:hypothetical protein
MKSIIIYIVLLFSLAIERASAQCLQNGDFDDLCQTTINPYCPTFPNQCVPHWYRSHGTPQVFRYYLDNPIYNAAYMWSYKEQFGDVVGEGMYNQYNFVANSTYKIKIRVNVGTDNGVNAGVFRLVATNGLTSALVLGCGDPIPTPANQETIVENTERNMGWKIYEYTYTPSANYSQFWIYPYMNYPISRQYHLYVDYVFICPSECEGTVIYNTGVVPSNETKAGNIYVGSSEGTGGSGTVTVASNQNTTLSAATEIRLSHNFGATVTTGQFVAKIIYPCNPTGTLPGDDRDSIDISQFPRDPVDSTEEEMRMVSGRQKVEGRRKRFTVYPNPAKGQVIIQQYSDKRDPFSMEVYDCNGRILVRKNENSYSPMLLKLDLSSYSTGYYFITITTKHSVETTKVLLQR